jgi:hypothetical protein
MRICFAGLVVLSPVALVSCGGDGNSLASAGGGTLEIVASTSGAELDPDGYAVSLDGVFEAAIGADATLRLDHVEPGAHTVELAGVAANCSLAGENPRAVSITPGDTTPVRFQVTCLEPAGGLTVTTTTSGSSPDPDGYILRLDDKDRLRMKANATVTFPELTAGSHLIELRDIAANCRPKEENPRAVTVTGGSQLTVAFTIDCAS